MKKKRSAPRRFRKHDRVQVFSVFDRVEVFSGSSKASPVKTACFGEGSIQGWLYDRSDKTYNYLVKMDSDPDDIQPNQMSMFEDQQLVLVEEDQSNVQG